MSNPNEFLKNALLTKQEVARFLHISVRSIDRMVRKGELKVIKVGGRRRFDPEDLRGIVATKGAKD